MEKLPFRLKAINIATLLFALLLFYRIAHTAEISLSPTQLIKVADQELWKFNYAKADSIYTTLLQQQPDNAELHWKLARLQVSVAESITSDKTDSRLRHYRKAETYARNSIAIDSTSSKGHTWLATSLALMADKIGTKEKLQRANEIKRELDTAIRLNPNDETAHSLLGSYYREAANIGWFRRMIGNAFIGQVPEGNLQLAEQSFKKAIILDPQMIRNYHELALVYLKQGNNADALVLLQKGVKLPIRIESDKRRLEQMQQLIKKHGSE